MTSTSTDRRYGTASSAAIKAPVRCATTAAITLNGLQTIDGVTVVADDRVLVKNQSSGAENGIYVADTGDWVRDIDFKNNRDVVQGTRVLVNEGTTNANTEWGVTTSGTITIDTTSIAWAQLSATGAPWSVASGGTGATTAADARTNLGISGAAQSQTAVAFTTGGSSTAFTLTPTPAISANAANLRFRVTFHTAAGATPTLAVSGKAALNLKYKDYTGAKAAITSSEIPSGYTADVECDGTDWVVLDPADVPKTAAPNTFTKPQRGSPSTDNDMSFDLTAKNNFASTPTAAAQLDFTNIASATGQSGIIVFVNSSAYTITKGSSVKCPAGMLTTISSTGTFLLAYYCDGTNVYVTNSGALT